jgi:hypothetical protein
MNDKYGIKTLNGILNTSMIKAITPKVGIKAIKRK